LSRGGPAAWGPSARLHLEMVAVRPPSCAGGPAIAVSLGPSCRGRHACADASLVWCSNLACLHRGEVAVRDGHNVPVRSQAWRLGRAARSPGWPGVSILPSLPRRRGSGKAAAQGIPASAGTTQDNSLSIYRSVGRSENPGNLESPERVPRQECHGGACAAKFRPLAHNPCASVSMAPEVPGPDFLRRPATSPPHGLEGYTFPRGIPRAGKPRPGSPIDIGIVASDTRRTAPPDMCAAQALRRGSRGGMRLRCTLRQVGDNRIVDPRGARL
jgi:hypothetical protein